MKRKHKIAVIVSAITENHFGQPLSEAEARWLAEHILDALKDAKRKQP